MKSLRHLASFFKAARICSQWTFWILTVHNKLSNNLYKFSLKSFQLFTTQDKRGIIFSRAISDIIYARPSINFTVHIYPIMSKHTQHACVEESYGWLLRIVCCIVDAMMTIVMQMHGGSGRGTGRKTVYTLAHRCERQGFSYLTVKQTTEIISSFHRDRCSASNASIRLAC